MVSWVEHEKKSFITSDQVLDKNMIELLTVFMLFAINPANAPIKGTAILYKFSSNNFSHCLSLAFLK